MKLLLLVVSILAAISTPEPLCPGAIGAEWQLSSPVETLTFADSLRLCQVDLNGISYYEDNDAVTGFGRSFVSVDVTAMTSLLPIEPPVAHIWLVPNYRMFSPLVMH